MTLIGSNKTPASYALSDPKVTSTTTVVTTTASVSIVNNIYTGQSGSIGADLSSSHVTATGASDSQTLAGVAATADAARTKTVNTRMPTASDSVDKGYPISSFWNGNTEFYQSIRSTAGSAVWQPITNNIQPLPLDLISGAIGAYGMQKLKASYAGNCITVTRASDSATANIGFVGSNLDTATLDAFLAGTTGAVTTWFDQSGNNNHATAVAATAPHLNAFSRIGNCRSILFDNVWNGTNFTPNCFFTVPSGVTATFNNSTAVALARTRNNIHAPHLLQWTNASTSSIVLGRIPYNTFNIGTYIPGAGQFLVYNVYPSATPYVSGYSAGASSYIMWKDETVSIGGATGNTATLAGGFIGSGPAQDTNSGYQEMAAVIFFNREITETQRQNLTASLHYNFGTYPQVKYNWVVDGDSITDGYGSTFMQNYPRQAELLLNRPMVISNYALFGDTMSGRLQNYITAISPAFMPNSEFNILSIFAGTNDLGSGVSAATLQQTLTYYCSLARSDGYKIIVASVLPRQGLPAVQ